jgi:uncharacterized protein (DUF433 family)
MQFPDIHRITLNPNIMGGKPCIRGLRYPVEFILEMLSGPTSVEEFLKDYSDLEEDDIRTAFAFGARMSRSKRFESLVAA